MRLDVQNISVHYTLQNRPEPLVAIEDISFQVGTGEFLAIIGPSGCGKTTILNTIAGLQTLTDGQILLDNKTLEGPGKDRAVVFQSPALMPWRTVLGNVVYGLELRGVKQQQAQAQAHHYIDLVGLQGFEQSYPNELSGGMQQRVNLARALTVEPSLLLLDEPLSALDAQTRAYMQWELQQIWQTTKNTAIYVTHHISEAIYLADQVLVMSARPGQIKEIVDIDIPRPRLLAVQQEPEFNRLERHIWTLLQAEAQKTGMLAAH